MIQKNLLIKLLIIITIVGTVIAIFLPDFLTLLKKNRDSKRKTDLRQIQKALQTYYEDKKEYPQTNDLKFGHRLIDSITGKLYIQEIPKDPNDLCTYYYISTGTDYKLYSYLENTEDEETGVNKDGYPSTDCGGINCPCRFEISSPNILP